MEKASLDKNKLKAVFIALFLTALGFGVILPVLPFYTERLALGNGVNPDKITFHIGFLTSVYPLFQIFFAPFWGRLSDNIGRRPLILIGIGGFILMQLLIGLSTSLNMLYLARIVGGVFTSAIIPVGYALVSDLTTDKSRALGIAWAGASYSLGIVSGPIIGGLLSRTDLHLYLRLGHFLINDYSIPFLFLFLLGLGLLPFLNTWLKHKETYEKRSLARMDSVQRKKLIASLSLFLGLSFLYQAGLTLFESVFSIYSKNELNFDAITIGYAFMVCALIMGLLQPIVVAEKIRKHLPPITQIMLGFGIFGVPVFLLAYSSNLQLILILIGFLSIGGALIIPNITSLISLKSSPFSGQALGLQNAANSFGQVSGPLLGSWLLTEEKSLPYLLTGGIMIFISLLLFCVKIFHSQKFEK